MKRLLFLLSFVLFLFPTAFGQQIKDAIQWQYNAKKTSDSTFDITIAAKIKEGWHIYTATPKGDGSQIPTTIKFDKNANVRLSGKITNNGKPVNEEIKDLGITIQYYKNAVTYTQKVVAKANTVLSGVVDFQICNDEMCLPSKPERFKIPLNGVVSSNIAASPGDTVASNEAMDDTMDSGATNMGDGVGNGKENTNGNTAVTNPESASEASDKGGAELEKSSLLELFLSGFAAGFGAFITPCVYAMLPITVSFFTKRSKDRKTGIKNALFYSFSIIAIFALIGLLISLSFKEDTMYTISTSIWFNLFVAAVFIIFGLSLLGAFEITLPSSWSTKLDNKANTNSYAGIFFMAMVLVVVSFSCTSAFLSFLIVQIVQAHNRIGGLIGFLGFGSAIAIPFALFAFFPGWLNGLARSGGWLNSVKVTMGFIELAMAMKFISNVDLQYHWHLLDFEVYLSIWIILALLLGLYLLGIIQFSHDSGLPKNDFGMPYLSVTRLMFAIAALSFTVYMLPGLWGAPLSGISGWLPERKTLDFNIHDDLKAIKSSGVTGSSGSSGTDVMPVKYTENLKSELPGVVAFFDYQEALAASKKTGKPVLLDFTGHSCVNCRKMERAVLSKPEVLRELSQHFILASLYCDDKTTLSEADMVVSKNGEKLTTLGDKNVELEVNTYGEIGQPIYIFVDENGKVIKKAGGYVPDVQRFLNIINEVKAAHKKS